MNRRFSLTANLLWMVTLLVAIMVCVFIYWAGKSSQARWNAIQAMIEKEGETLDFRLLLPETIPATENLLAIEPLHGITEVIDGNGNLGKPGAKRKALEEQIRGIEALEAPPSDYLLGETLDWSNWMKSLRKRTGYVFPSNQEVSGQGVLIALDKIAPILKQLADESVTTGRSQFVPSLRERNFQPNTEQNGHYNLSVKLAFGLYLRALAAIEARNSGEATHCIIAIKRISKACKSDPLLMSWMFGSAVEQRAEKALWYGLERRIFGENELVMLEPEFGQDKSADRFLVPLRGELAMSRQFLDQDQIPGVTYSGTLAKWVNKPLRNTWKSEMAVREMRLIRKLKTSNTMAALAEAKLIKDELEAIPIPRLRIDLRSVYQRFPTYHSIIGKVVMSETRNEQARAAIALERYYLQHREYPDSLASLVPEFLPLVMLDPCDGKPIRYAKTPKGRYRLWSVAFDMKDDNGKADFNSAEPSAPNNPRNPNYLGDWAWQYDPVK